MGQTIVPAPNPVKPLKPAVFGPSGRAMIFFESLTITEKLIR